MRLLLAAVLCTALSLTAVAAPIQFGPEIPLSAPEYGEPFDVQAQARLDTNGTSYFAIWTDHRSGFAEVYGTRFSHSGEVLDPLGIRFGFGVAGDVVWTGTTFLIAWRSTPNEVSIATVNPDGTRTPSRVLLTAQSPDVWPIDLTRGTTTVLLTTNEPEAALLHLDGVPLKALIITDSDAGSPAAFAAGKYQVATSGFGFIGRLEIDETGKISAYCCGHIGGATPESPVSMDVASDGTSNLLLWTRTHATAELWNEQNVRVRTVTPSQRRAIAGAHATWRGNEYLLTLSEDGQLYAVRLNGNGTPISAPSDAFAQTLPGEGADVASRENGTGAGAWSEAAGGVFAGLFDSGSLATQKAPFFRTFELAQSARQQIAPRFTRAGEELFAAWLEPDNDAIELKLSRYPAEPVTVAEIDGGPYEIVGDDNVIWVLWVDGTTVQAKRYTRALAPIDAEPLEIDIPGQALPPISAAAGGGSLLLLWHTRESLNRFVGTIVRGAGAAVQEIEVPISFESEPGHLSAAAWDGNAFVAAWLHPQPFSANAFALRSVRISAAGSLLNSTPTEVFGADSFDTLHASRAGGKVVLAWQTGNVTYATNVTGGVPSIPRVVASIGAANEPLTRVVGLRNGESLFAWSRDDGTTGTMRVERMSHDLAPLGETTQHSILRAPLAVAAAQTMSWFDLGAIGLDAVLVYSRRTEEEIYAGAPRVFARRGGIKRRAVR